MNRSDVLVKNLSGEMSYHIFKPSPLPPSGGITISERMLKLVSEANVQLAELKTAKAQTACFANTEACGFSLFGTGLFCSYAAEILPNKWKYLYFMLQLC